MVSVTLDSGIADVVGARTAKALEKAFAIRTARELLDHVPRRYSKRGELTQLDSLPIGEQVSVVAQVLDARERRMQRRNGVLTEVRITDGVGTLALTFFNQKWQAEKLKPGVRGTFAGKVNAYQGRLQLQHPDYQLFDDPDEAPGAELLDEAAAKAWSETPVPIYPATAQVPTWTIQSSVELVLDALAPIEDPLPAEVQRAEGILPLGQAIELIHRPKRDSDWQRAQQSLRFREAFDLQLALLARRMRMQIAESRARSAVSGGLLDAFDDALPFSLTGDQRAVGQVIRAEMDSERPMHRLLQGEVGSGKTLVALRAMLQVAEDGGQSAMLAPTEVLAGQHFRSIVEALGPDLTAKLNPVLLTGKMPAAERKRALLSLASGTARIAVGTHALLSDTVSFYDLGLIVVDEQHRFGVEQRETLRQKGAQPHVLAMTATPIPRTIALTAFGDLETLTIRELPPGRQGIETFVVPELEMPRRAARVWARSAEDIASGRQVYVVCPAIEPGGKAEDPEAASPDDAEDGKAAKPMANVMETVAWLRSMPQFEGMQIEALTGAMASDEKDRVMGEFSSGRTNILVATTVIEVGVNVPNASIMIVRDADRFGVSQLHQLRGRVGRGEHPGLCLLMTTAEQGTKARERIEAVAATSDGFVLAEIDLDLRREGDILGTVQSGNGSTLKLLRVTKDGDIIAHARDVAEALLTADPALSEHPILAARLAQYGESGRLENLAKS
ncbi:ATP-dependent DNA helicase RecG [Leucobacter sp. cx-42]|uniref:ATP-dependent DNA helicase RecG n=1 Tax=unclassified Leucobacter TaxID=2621730 RepID=UPI00165DB38A|nr:MULTISPECIES: ATP-dependent DNA helicase RecG [unclassified Leucobacter]MBC9954700.1 ATP-dependent DNA helicase RecG [Leucobacter sp. cx-42]